MSDAGDPILVTGAAGFIGSHVAHRLLRHGRRVVGADNLSSYYDPALKRARLERLRQFTNFHFEQIDLADRPRTGDLFSANKFPLVVHFAAQPGVRYSLVNPHTYVEANIDGFLNVLEGCRHNRCQHLLYASSSSVYGGNNAPFRLAQNVDHPLNLYGATKKANELMAHAYAHLFGLPTTGLRFFTVYGPWGRPDMALWLFTQAILEGTPVRLFDNGNLRRDFTFIDDVTEAVVRLIDRPAAPDPDWSAAAPNPAMSFAPWRVYNIGNSMPVAVNELVRLIEQATGRVAVREVLPGQPGDMLETCADVADLEAAVGYRPATPLADGVGRFVDWYRGYVANQQPQRSGKPPSAAN
ncbi:MAG: NAD-dependent epimerase [Alphaproteobacteria bacterium]